LRETWRGCRGVRVFPSEQAFFEGEMSRSIALWQREITPTLRGAATSILAKGCAFIATAHGDLNSRFGSGYGRVTLANTSSRNAE
jgi:hypothetical protein